jgi:hypothetical protein
MKLEITVPLEAGGTVTIVGEELNAEGVNEVLTFLNGYTVETTPNVEED